jgi:hypothetical protein
MLRRTTIGNSVRPSSFACCGPSGPANGVVATEFVCAGEVELKPQASAAVSAARPKRSIKFMLFLKWQR